MSDPSEEPPRLRPAFVRQPKVIGWFKIYCGGLVALNLGLAAMSLIFFNLPEPVPGEVSEHGEFDAVMAPLMGAMFLGLGLLFAVGCFLPLVLKPCPWVWVYNLVIICLGFMSACCMPRRSRSSSTG